MSKAFDSVQFCFLTDIDNTTHLEILQFTKTKHEYKYKYTLAKLWEIHILYNQQIGGEAIRVGGWAEMSKYKYKNKYKIQIQIQIVRNPYSV